MRRRRRRNRSTLRLPPPPPWPPPDAAATKYHDEILINFTYFSGLSWKIVTGKLLPPVVWGPNYTRYYMRTRLSSLKWRGNRNQHLGKTILISRHSTIYLKEKRIEQASTTRLEPKITASANFSKESGILSAHLTIRDGSSTVCCTVFPTDLISQ